MTFSLPQQQQRIVAKALPTATAAVRAESERCADARSIEQTRLPVLQTRSASKPTKSVSAQRTSTHNESSNVHSNQRLSSVAQQERQRMRRGHAGADLVTRKRKPNMAAAAACRPTSPNALSSTNSLSVMDERVLMLYHASLKQSWAPETATATATTATRHLDDQDQHNAFERARLLRKFGHEATFAATQIQRVVRGGAARVQFASFEGPRHQRAAKRMQFTFRRLVVCQRVARRVHCKKVASAVRIQSWYRGCRCREQLLDAQARVLVHGVVVLQRHVRGHRFWRLVAALLHDRRCRAATEVQRCVRGRRGRQRANAVRFEQQRYVRHLVHITAVHRSRARCALCELASCSEDSLFDCFMARYVGLHDLLGARTLCLDGLQLFPTSGRFAFFFAVLTLVLCDDIGTAMAFLTRARHVLCVTDDELATYEQQYLVPALQLRPTDAAAHLDLALFCQCSDDVARAEALYAKALALRPTEYAVPGYLHRVQTLDRLLGNYQRFCSLWNSRQTNVLVKTLAVAKRSELVRVMVAKMNQFTAIFATDAADATRISPLYLSDDDVRTFLSGHGSTVAAEKASTNDLDAAGAGAAAAATESASALERTRTLRSLASSRGLTMRQRTKRNLAGDSTAVSGSEPPAAAVVAAAGAPVPLTLPGRSFELVQIFQRAFCGLNVRPAKLAAPSEKRSKLVLTREHAELLLQHVVFVPAASASLSSPLDMPNNNSTSSSDTTNNNSVMVPAPMDSPPAYIMLLPSVLKDQQQRRAAALQSHAAIDLQRVFRGFQLRAATRREQLIQRVQQQQVDRMLAHLQRNFAVREQRRASAVAIQRIAKGAALRQHMRQSHAAATHIQRVFRGVCGRKRALAFRDGNCTFYMAERVYQRGVEVSGRRVLLAIDQCGLSFRLDGYDFERCVSFPGFVSRASALALLCHVNWRYAESFVGRECAHAGQQLAIARVASVNRETAECAMICRVLRADATTGSSSTSTSSSSVAAVDEVTVMLADCIQSINLRALSTLGRDAQSAAAPITLDNTARIVDAIVERLTLVRALPMATKELKKKTSAGFVLTLTPPPKMHMLFHQSEADDSTTLDRVAARDAGHATAALRHVLIEDPTAIQFPVTDSLRGVSLGAGHFRQKCARHARHFTRCRCVLPVTTTAAHIDTLTLALTPVWTAPASVPASASAPRHEHKTL